MSSWGGKGGGNGNGPWGNHSSGGGSGGGRGGNTPPGGPDLDDFFRKGQDRFKNVFGGDGGDPDNKKASIIVLVLGIILWLGSGFYTVDTTEQGVILRFGEYHRTEGPGLHYHLPWPVERVYTPSVTSINKEEIGFREARGGIRTIMEESHMLTGDLNVVDVNFTVQWKIDSAETDNFLFNMRRPDLVVKPVAESAMREVVGQMPMKRVIEDGQEEISTRSQEIMQKMVDSYDAGIRILSVNLSKPDVPAEVIDAFQDVKRAEQGKSTSINKAEAYRNELLPQARGKAVKAEQEALAYKREVMERAQGDVARFLSVYEEYKQAKDVTKKRLYLETMEDVLGNMNKFIIDDKSGKGVLPYLPLNELNRSGGRS